MINQEHGSNLCHIYSYLFQSLIFRPVGLFVCSQGISYNSLQILVKI